MEILVKNPVQAFVSFVDEEERTILRKALTYTNTSNKYLVKKHHNNFYWKQRNPDSWNEHLKALEKNVINTLLYEQDGKTYIRPGSIPNLQLGEFAIYRNEIKYPTPKKIAWEHILPFELYDYQEASWQALLEVKHGNVELCTGAGKSAILLKICRESGFRTAIIAPSKSIFNELVEKFEYHLGKKNVGKFGDGKKTLGKRFTICIGDSIANVKPNTPEWEFFSNLEMICVDESHTWGAESLEEICHGVLAQVPYRMFFSGTQTRGDGSAKLLQSIIGKTVHTLTTAEAKQKGYICDHDFKIVELDSSNPSYTSREALDLKRAHFLRNRNIGQFIARLASAVAQQNGDQTLVLVEELGQISMLAQMLTEKNVPFAIAHSESKKDRLEELGLEKVDNAESVEKFNKNEVKVLIGTSCIATGTNIFPMRHTVNWVGGSSEIRTKQGAVGRSVRLHNANPWKDRCNEKKIVTIWDFNVRDQFVMEAHLKLRLEYYKDSQSEISLVRLPR